MLGLVEPSDLRVIDTGRVIVEISGGFVSTVSAPSGMQVVVVDHDLLQEATSEEIKDLFALTPEIAWGTPGYGDQFLSEDMVFELLGSNRRPAPPMPPDLPAGKAIVEVSGCVCQVIWTPPGVGSAALDHDDLYDPATSDAEVEARIAELPELPWGSEHYDYRFPMTRPTLPMLPALPPFDAASFTRRQPSGFAQE